MARSLIRPCAAVFALCCAATAVGAQSTADLEALRPTVETAGSAYAHALASLALWAILMPVLSMIATVGTPKGKTESGHPFRDYSDPAYRRHRAFQNAIEITGPFIAATVAAILAGGAPFWVNLLASVFLVSRIAVAVVHIRTEIEPLRSAIWMVGLLCVLGLALIALVGAFVS